MRDDPHGVNYLVADSGGDPADGRVVFDPASFMWNGGMLAITLIGGPLTFSGLALVLFVVTTAAGLLLGHSIGYHRKLIHGSFACKAWLEKLLVWFGAYVGMAGPFGIIRTHDLRDWAQRQSVCHPYLSHRTSMLRDAWWQIYCRLELRQPPQFDLGKVGTDRFYQWLEATWRWQQLPIALIFYAIGGWGWVIWGVAARVAVANHGHWLVGHFAHRHGPQTWIVEGCGVQAFDVPWAAIPTMGEAWHNNHHAYPGSARIGLYPGQMDAGYAVIRVLERFGLVWSVATPVTLPNRRRLTPIRH